MRAHGQELAEVTAQDAKKHRRGVEGDVMNTARTTSCGLLVIFLLSSVVAWAETPSEQIRVSLDNSIDEVVRVRTAGRGEFQGRLVSVNDERIEIEDGEGQILSISTAQITAVVVMDQTRSPDTYFQDAAANKLVLMPVGFGMEPGELHVADQELVVVSMSYGVSRHFSVWGALSIPGVLLNARFSGNLGEAIGVSAGSFAGVVFLELGAAVALPYVIASFGSPHQNFTIGVGVPFYTSSVVSYEQMFAGGALALGGKIVLSRTASLVTENWIVVGTYRAAGAWGAPAGVFVPSLSFRIAGSRFSWDLGITMPLLYADSGEGYRLEWVTGGQPIPLPLLGFTYRIQ